MESHHFATLGKSEVLQVQEMLHICTDHYEQDEGKSKEKDKKDKDKKEDKEKDKEKAENKEVDLSSQQSVAVLGLWLLSLLSLLAWRSFPSHFTSQ